MKKTVIVLTLGMGLVGCKRNAAPAQQQAQATAAAAVAQANAAAAQAQQQAAGGMAQANAAMQNAGAQANNALAQANAAMQNAGAQANNALAAANQAMAQAGAQANAAMAAVAGARPAGAGPATPLAVPGQATGALQTGDQALADLSLGDDYALMLTAGQPVTIVVRGRTAIGEAGNMDAYAVLMFGGAEVTHDDDSAGGPDGHDSRIVYTPTATGPHTLRVTTYGGGLHQGNYEVQTWSGANAEAH